jgi:hypothetical protein
MEQIAQPLKGLLDPLLQLGFKPIIQQNTLVFEMGEAELKNIFFQNVNPQYRHLLDLKIENNKIKITVKLF